jgi:hypothetical protein
MKYKIMILCNDTAEYDNIYVDFVDKLFNTKEDAQQVLKQCVLDELTTLNEDTDDSVLYVNTPDNFIWYELDINGVYRPQYWVSQYVIIRAD